jgi:membrane protease subunit HflK
VLAEYAKAPEVTRQRMYLETMQQVYANTSKVMVDAKGQGNLLYLPLDKLMQAAARHCRHPAPEASVARRPAKPRRPVPMRRRSLESAPKVGGGVFFEFARWFAAFA